MASALASLHRTLDKPRFDPEDTVSDLEVLIRTAKRCNDPKSREYECALEEVQKNVKTLTVEALRNLCAGG